MVQFFSDKSIRLANGGKFYSDKSMKSGFKTWFLRVERDFHIMPEPKRLT